MVPEATRTCPSQRTAQMPRFNERLMAGEKRAMTRIALRIEAESSPLAPANRFSS